MDFTRCYSCMQELDRPGGRCPRCGNDNTTLARSQPSHALPCGYLLHGKYVIGRTLGQGGFGVTYIGWDLALETRVCIKEYFPAGAAMRSSTMSTTVTWSGGNNGEELKRGRESFIKEARKAVKLRDLNSVVKVWDVFYENETAYLVMDYVEGVTLKHHLMETRKPLSEEECMHLLAPVMKDLEEVHARGIIHRDISPDNLMLRPDGMLVLLDIGAAKDLSRGNGQSSMLVAKKGFSPMEQYTTGGSIGPWTDVYAMCATMVYCVTGNLLPEPIDRLAGTEVDLRAFSPAFAETLKKGLAVRPEERIQTMEELEAGLSSALKPGVMADPQREQRKELGRREQERREREKREATSVTEARPAPPPPKKKSKLPLILAAVAVLALAIFGVTKLAGGKTASPAEPEAVIETPEPTQDPQALLYAEAEAELEAGRPTRAFKAFRELGDYRDASERAEKIAHDMRKANCRPIAAGGYHTLGLRSNGTVVAAGPQSYQADNHGQCDVSEWSDIVSVAAGFSHSIGLKADGTVIATRYIDTGVGYDRYYGQCEVSDWTDIVAIAAGEYHSVGLKADGTVIATEYIETGDQNNYFSRHYGQCEVSDWTDIVAVSAGWSHTVGLRENGTVVAVGSNKAGQCDVSSWTDIVAIAAGAHHTVGLKSDGTLVATGSNSSGECDVSAFRDIVAVSAGGTWYSGCTVGVKADGTAVAVGTYRVDSSNNNIRYVETNELISGWQGIAAISSSSGHIVGLLADGTVVAAGQYSSGQCKVSDWTDIGVPTAILESTSASEPESAPEPVAAGKTDLASAEVGDTVLFGTYEQDNDIDNGKEDIEWLVLEKQKNRILVISRYGLDCQRYNKENTPISWENCKLRKWLNDTFLNDAFSEEEKALIPTVTVSADKNPSYNTYTGNNTQDQIFLLSIPEAERYFASDTTRQCKPTVYAETQELSASYRNTSCWWLRSPGLDSYCAAYIGGDGSVNSVGLIFSSFAVRPAMWIDLKS